MSRYLPEEIILNILSRLQVNCILRFRCVCKSWSKLLTSHDFVKKHLNHALDHKNNCNLVFRHYREFYLIDSISSSELCYEIVEFDPPFKSRLSYDSKPLASCNGLLCVFNDFGYSFSFFIWNPSTKEYKEISPSIPSETYGYTMAYGFGYDCKIDDYKLVTIVNMEANVYTLRSSSWRKVQSVPHNPFVPKQQDGVLLNRVLHWTNASTGSQVILSFDIGDERFQEIELPNCSVGVPQLNVGVLSGDLCVLHHTGDHSTDVWVMKDYGVIESWAKLFSFASDSYSYYFKPVHSFKNGEILFWARLLKENVWTYALVSYDPKHERVRTLKSKGIPILLNSIETYVGSLVSPNRILL